MEEELIVPHDNLRALIDKLYNNLIDDLNLERYKVVLFICYFERYTSMVVKKELC